METPTMKCPSLRKLCPLALAFLATGCLSFVGRSCMPENPGVGEPTVRLGSGTLAVLPFPSRNGSKSMSRKKMSSRRYGN